MDLTTGLELPLPVAPNPREREKNLGVPARRRRPELPELGSDDTVGSRASRIMRLS